MPDLVGQQLGNYSIIKLIGRGGFGEVYLGEHLILSRRQVAIKVLHSSIDQVGERENFLREAQLLARLEHPHILSILDAGIYDGFPYLVTKYALNGTLRQRYSKGIKVPLETAVSYSTQVASALQYAHDQMLIHRDVKPENMFLNENNEVLLGDFGIAIPNQNAGITQDSAGTPFYMSPEQFQGHASAASDQYSLGVVIYEWLCGNLPYQGNIIQVFYQHTHEAPPSLTMTNPKISLGVETVVMKALEKDPKQRFPKVSDFAEALEQAARSTTVSLRDDAATLPPSPFTRTIDGLKQPSQEIADDQGVMESFRVPTPNNESTPTLAELLPDVSVIGRPTLPPVVDDPGLDQTFVPMPTVNVTVTPKSPSLLQTAQSFLVSLLPTVNAPQGTRRTVVQGATTSIWRGHTQEVYAVTWSPDGRYIASGGADKTIQIWDRTATRKLPGYRLNGKVYAVAWSPDGRYIAAAGSDKAVHVWDVVTARKYFSYPVTGEVHTIAWSPDGRYIAVGGTNRAVHVWDMRVSSELWICSSHADWVRAVTWSPDSKYIASASNDQTIRIWDIDSRTAILTYTNHTAWVRAVAWSPDGNYIASASYDKTVQVWRATTGQMKRSYHGHASSWMGEVLAVVWSPDGSSIASAGEDQKVQLWDTNTGATLFTYDGHSAPVDALGWSPDRQSIASASYDTTVQIWQALGGVSNNTVVHNPTTQKKTVY